MKIGSPADKPPVVPAATGRATSGDASAKTNGVNGTTAPAEASAQVEISSAAASLLQGVGGSTAEFDAEKVARISKAIEDGTFKVNHAAIADKLISNAQELLTKASH
jgi:negative regulator of flagellin synthesis FlgM